MNVFTPTNDSIKDNFNYKNYAQNGFFVSKLSNFSTESNTRLLQQIFDSNLRDSNILSSKLTEIIEEEIPGKTQLPMRKIKHYSTKIQKELRKKLTNCQNHS